MFVCNSSAVKRYSEYVLTTIGIFLVAPIKGRYRTVPAVMNADCTHVPENSYNSAAGISFQPAP